MQTPANLSHDPQATTRPTSDHMLAIHAMEKPSDEWTAEEAEAMKQYQEVLARREAEASRREASRREGNERSRQYWQRLRAIEQAEREASVEWFKQQLSTSNTITPIRINKPSLPLYLTEAYRHQVSLRGGALQLDTFTQQAINDTARWLSSHTKPGLLLRGYIGVGKTTMLHAIASLFLHLTKQRLPIADARHIAALAKDNPTEFAHMVKSPLLGIDDLGTEPTVVKHYGNELSPLAELLYERYNRRAFTLITTNLTIVPDEHGKQTDQLLSLYGDRIFDRLHEMFNTISYDCQQKSYRK